MYVYVSLKHPHFYYMQINLGVFVNFLIRLLVFSRSHNEYNNSQFPCRISNAAAAQYRGYIFKIAY